MNFIDIQNQSKSITNSTNAAYAANSKVGNSNLGQDAFLRLMIEQMKNQDPTSPTDNTQMLLQNAQFTQVSELQKLNNNITSMNGMSQALGLMGKYVALGSSDGSTKVTNGIVSEVRSNEKGVSIILKGSDATYPVSLVQNVREASATDPEKPVVTNSGTVNASQYRGGLTLSKMDSATATTAK